MANATFDYFLLSADHRDRNGRFEITLWGAGANGARGRVFVDDFRPMFFCARSVPTDKTRGADERKPLPMRAMDGRDVDCLYFKTYSMMQQTAKRMRAEGLPVFETDVNPLSRYLMERMVGGAMRVTGAAGKLGIYENFVNPRLRGGIFTPELRVMSVCIDMCIDVCINMGDDGRNDGGDGGGIAGIGCAEEGDSHYFSRDLGSAGEKGMLIDFIAYIKKRDPDIITGWGVAGHTLRIIQERCAKHGVPFDIGREGGSRVTSSERSRTWRDGYTSTKTVWTARVPGRAVMDLPVMLREYFHDPDDYQLNSECGMRNAELTSTPTSTATPTISNCLTNAKKILDIFCETEILPNAIERSRRSGQILGGAGGSVASFDYLYLPRLHRAGFVAKDVRDITEPTRSLPGGHVLEPTPGLYENVLVFDFKSLYPSIIMTFMIDPLGFNVKNNINNNVNSNTYSDINNNINNVNSNIDRDTNNINTDVNSNINNNDIITTPVGTSFSRKNHILPNIIRELMDARAAAVAQKNPYLSQAIKILMNSFYGVLGSTGCRFFSEEISSTITMTGQYILKSSIAHIEKTYGKKVIYGDTDSLFVNLGEGAQDSALSTGKDISAEINNRLRARLGELFGAESKLELKFETHFRRFFIPSIRGGGIGQGAKKHYCGAEVKPDGTMELTFKGMESARNDWTALAKDFQRELFIKFFSDLPLEEYIISIADKVGRGELDDKLVYKKRVRKNLADYTVNIPPHVQAAKLLGRSVKSISYLITKEGPQPAEMVTAPIDYQHYIDCQLRPIADDILEWSGKSFDKIVSGQQDLFE